MGRNIITAKLDPEGEEPVIIVTRGNDQQILKTLTSDLKPPNPVVEDGINLWSTPDGDLQLVFSGNGAGIGSKKNLEACLFWSPHWYEDTQSELLKKLTSTKAPIATVGRDNTSAAQIADMLSEKKSDDAKTESTYFTETRFTKTGIERRTVSDFGLIGSIIAQLAQD